MDRTLEVGSPVHYVDATGGVHNALVTAVWGVVGGVQPGCNLVIVSPDTSKTDPYGRQIERFTSVVHKSAQPAYGWYWKWPEEEQNPILPGKT